MHKRVGELKCQEDSYLRVFTSTVESCVPAGDNWHVVCDDTILFPTGGGQPNDLGSFKWGENESAEVIDVFRDKQTAVHVVTREVPVGTTVTMHLDWERRYDHMQQHSGQHLVSAMCETLFNVPTLSWDLGPAKDALCYVELSRKLTDAEVQTLQERVNKEIQAATEMSISVVTNLEDVDTSKIPADYDFKTLGFLRMARIGNGVDYGLCCGTHLKSTAEIGSCSILNQTPGKQTNWRVHYVLGDRAHRLLKDYDALLRAVGLLMSCGNDTLITSVKRQNENLRMSLRTNKEMQKELARKDAVAVEKQVNESKRWSVVRKEPEPDYVNVLMGAVHLEDDAVLLVINGTKKDSAIYFVGRNATTMGAEACALLPNLKGNGKGDRWQGKLCNVTNQQLKVLGQWFSNTGSVCSEAQSVQPTASP